MIIDAVESIIELIVSIVPGPGREKFHSSRGGGTSRVASSNDWQASIASFSTRTPSEQVKIREITIAKEVLARGEKIKNLKF